MSFVQSIPITSHLSLANLVVSLTPFGNTMTGAPVVSNLSQIYEMYRSENSSRSHGDSIPVQVSKIWTASHPARIFSFRESTTASDNFSNSACAAFGSL